MLSPEDAILLMKKHKLLKLKVGDMEFVMDPRGFDAPAAPVQNEEKEEDDTQLKHDMDEDILFHSGS